MMLLDYRIIQFSRAPMRCEGRNIGIIAFDTAWAGFKSIGMFNANDKPNLFSFSSVAGSEYKECLWIFGEWIEWFKALCIEAKGNPGLINKELDALQEDALHFSAIEGGCVEMLNESYENTLEELFSELVGQPLIPVQDTFKSDLEQALGRAEIAYLPGFEKGIEITIEERGGQPAAIFILDYYLSEGKRMGFKVLRFHHAHTKSLITKLNDILTAFTEAQRTGFLERDRCIVLCDTAIGKKSNYVERLQSVATVINVTEKDAHRKIYDIYIRS